MTKTLSDKEERAFKRKRDRNYLNKHMREDMFFKLRVERPKVEYKRKEKHPKQIEDYLDEFDDPE